MSLNVKKHAKLIAGYEAVQMEAAHRFIVESVDITD